MPCGDGEADLVVQLGRRGDVAFLLDMKSHAGGPGCNAATIRSESAGDNWLCVPELVTISNSPSGDWVDLTSGAVPLRCWWSPTASRLDDIGNKSTHFRVVIVLSELFGVNSWERSVADRLRRCSYCKNGAWARFVLFGPGSGRGSTPQRGYE